MNSMQVIMSSVLWGQSNNLNLDEQPHEESSFFFFFSFDLGKNVDLRFMKYSAVPLKFSLLPLKHKTKPCCFKSSQQTFLFLNNIFLDEGQS